MPQASLNDFQIIQNAFTVCITVFGPIFVAALVAGLGFRLGTSLIKRRN